MYALHEHGESHDENSENGSKKSGNSRLDNLASPEDIHADDTGNDLPDELLHNRYILGQMSKYFLLLFIWGNLKSCFLIRKIHLGD